MQSMKKEFNHFERKSTLPNTLSMPYYKSSARFVAILLGFFLWTFHISLVWASPQHMRVRIFPTKSVLFVEDSFPKHQVCFSCADICLVKQEKRRALCCMTRRGTWPFHWASKLSRNVIGSLILPDPFHSIYFCMPIVEKNLSRSALIIQTEAPSISFVVWCFSIILSIVRIFCFS